MAAPSLLRAVVPALAAAAILAGASGGCDTPAPPPARRTLRLTTGTPGASFYPLSQALARVWGQTLADLAITTLDRAGSVANVQALQSGDADVGLAYADVAYAAYAGRFGAPASPADAVRGVAVLELDPVHLVVRRGLAVARAADLRGRRVAVGPAGSGSAVTAQMVLAAHGIDAGNTRIESLLYNEAAGRLAAGTIDALMVTSSDPVDSVRDAMAAGARLLPLTGPAIDRLRHEYPFYRATVIPGGTYPGHAEPLDTIGVDNLLLCRRGLDETLVHDLTFQFFAGLPSLSMLSVIDLDQAPATPIPLHDGAARYYRERELWR